MSEAIEKSAASEQPTQATSQLRIAPLTELPQFERCVELQLAVWGYSEGDLIPKRVFIVASRIGGQVIGAFDGDPNDRGPNNLSPERIVGFAMAFPGYRDRYAYLHSHMLAVLPEYRNAGLGRRLKLAQRDDALARGFDLMEWTFDPLEIKNAYFNIARLGAISRRYKPDFYGPSSSPLQGGLPTDRLYAEWWLRSPRVRHILGEEAETLEKSTENTPVSEQIVVPAGVYDWKSNPAERKLAADLQMHNRLALQSAFERGLAVTGYERTPAGDGIFLLGPTSLELHGGIKA